MAVKPCEECGGEKPRGKGYRLCTNCVGKHPHKKKNGCKKCGEPKIPGSGHIYCQECSDMEKWKLQKRRAYLPSRQCTKCNALVEKGRRLCSKCREKKIMCQKCHKSPVRGLRKNLCEGCYLEGKEQSRRYRRDWQRKQRLDPVKAEKQRAWDRAYYKKRMKNKEIRLRANEARRLWWRLNHGVKLVSEETYEKNYLKGITRLPAAPLSAAMESFLSRGHTCYEIARTGDLEEKRVREVYSCRIATVRIDIADKIAMAIGTTLDLVYLEEPAKDENPPLTDLAC